MEKEKEEEKLLNFAVVNVILKLLLSRFDISHFSNGSPSNSDLLCVLK